MTLPLCAPILPQDFFVFNREYLYADVETLSQELAEDPALAEGPAQIELVQPPTPRSLEAIVIWAQNIADYVHAHTSTCRHHHSALGVIQSSAAVALQNLLSHSGNVKVGSSSTREGSQRELQRMRDLLGGYQRDLEILSLVDVNPRLLPSNNSASKRTLVDFISRSKMGAVADACHKVYTELHASLEELESNSEQLERDTSDLQNEVENTSIQPSTETLEEAVQAEARAVELVDFLLETCSPDANGWPVADKLDAATIGQIQEAVKELYLLDEVARESVRRLTADKNDMTARSLTLLGDISGVQSDYAELSVGLSAFDAELHSKKVEGFRHLARLNKVFWAYGATVVEVIRRREFAKHFLGKSQALAELMAKVSARERKRRGKYRSDVAGQLPWEVKGLDEAPPSLEISTSRSSGLAPELDRQDLDNLLQLVQDIEETLAKADAINGDSSGEALSQVKEVLQQMISRLDSMDDEFHALVEENLLGLDEDDEGDNGSESSDGEATKRPRQRRLNGDSESLQAARKENERLQQEVRDLLRQAEERERSDHEQHHTELNSLRAESSAARSENRKLQEEVDDAKREHSATKSQLDALRSEVETERERRLNMQEELSMLRKETQAARKAEAEARREATEEAEHLAEAELHVQDLQAELEEAKAARIDASNRIENLLSEGSNIEKELSSAQERIEDLMGQLEQARQEAREARDAHAEAEAAKERVIRHHRAEADGDRAILEENLREKSAALDDLRSELERVREGTQVEADAVQTLRSQLRGADEAHEELVKAMEAAKDASADAELAKRHAERESEQLHDLVKPLLQRMLEIREHVQSLPALSSSRAASASTPAAGEEKQLEAVSQEDEEEASRRQAALSTFITSPDDADVAATLDALRAVSPREIAEEATNRLDVLVTLVRKWQKTYKRQASDSAAKLNAAVRERIAFRNFQVGDLALFLPSRNNALDTKPWAAFNISYPHFFLNAPAGSILAEQLRTKEWIVARIVRIVERVTDSKQEGGNPFQLAEGVRFCLLDVDGWNPNSPVTQRSGLKSRSTSTASELPRLPSSRSGITAALQGSTQAGSSRDQSPQGAKNDASDGTATLAGATSTSSAAGAEEKEEATGQEPVSESRDLVPPEVSTHSEGQTGTSPQKPQTAASEGVAAPGDFSKSLIHHAAVQDDRTTVASSPSGLTRAMRAASSRSPSSSRTLDQTLTSSPSNGTIRTNGTKRPFNGSAPPDGALAKSHVSTESSSGAAPAFGGVRGRRRGGLRLGSNPPASAATSPGTLAAPIPARTAELSFEAMGNPFSQSPGGPFAASSLPRNMMAHRKDSGPSKLGSQSQPSEDASGQATSSSPAGTTPDAADSDARSPSRQTSQPVNFMQSHRSPSMASVAITAGSLTLPGSPSRAALSRTPLNAEASLAQARGETSSRASRGAKVGGAEFDAKDGGEDKDEDQDSTSNTSRFSNMAGGGGPGSSGFSGIASSPLAAGHGTRSRTISHVSSRSPPAGGEAAGTEAAGSVSRSPSFLAKTFGAGGRRMSVRNSVASLFPSGSNMAGSGVTVREGASTGGGGAGGAKEAADSSVTASEMLRRLNSATTPNAGRTKKS